MGEEIANPHDKLFKQLLGEAEHAASFLGGNLPAEVVAHLDLSSLEVVQSSFIDAQFRQSEADLLFSLRIAGRPGYVYCLFEHQSSPDRTMLLRMLGYMVRIWKRFQRDAPQGSLLPVILPLVLFHGPRGWQGPTAFAELVDLPGPEFLAYTPVFQCRLYDLSPYGRERLAGNAVVRILWDLLGAYGDAEGEKRIERALSTLNELLDAPGFARYLEILFRYVLQVFDLPGKSWVPW